LATNNIFLFIQFCTFPDEIGWNAFLQSLRIRGLRKEENTYKPIIMGREDLLYPMVR